jgi:hypothetical protein
MFQLDETIADKQIDHQNHFQVESNSKNQKDQGLHSVNQNPSLVCEVKIKEKLRVMTGKKKKTSKKGI